MLKCVTSIRSVATRSMHRRCMATAATGTTKYTTLSNGVVVASEHNPAAPSSSIGVYYGAGSRSEYPLSNGIAALTNSILASGPTANGVMVSALNAREINGIVAHSTNDNVAAAAERVASIVSLSDAALEKADYEVAKKALLARANAIEADPTRKVLEHMNASAFQGYSLGLPVFGTAESIPGLVLQDSQRHLNAHLVSSNTVVAALGNFDHDVLVNALEKSLKITEGVKSATKPATFLGSEVRMRDDTLPKAYVSIAVQGEGFNSPAYYVAKVAAAVFGSFDHTSPQAAFTSPKLALIVQEYHIVDTYSHFSNSYSDTGLWGFTSESSNFEGLCDWTHFALKQWNRLSTTVSDAEVARAKNAVKAELIMALSSSDAVALDIAHKILLAGHRASLNEQLAKIDAITVSTVQQWAKAALWDKDIVVSGVGQTEGLLDYNRNRNEMAPLRW